MQSPNLNPEVDFQLYGSHLEKAIGGHNSSIVRLITMKFGKQMQNDMLMTTHGSIWKPEVELQKGDRPFQKPEVVLSQPWIKIFYRNLVQKEISG